MAPGASNPDPPNQKIKRTPQNHKYKNSTQTQSFILTTPYKWYIEVKND